MQENIKLALILLYRAALIGALMYTVGYLGWSAWWLLMLSTLVSFDDSVKSKMVDNREGS